MPTLRTLSLASLSLIALALTGCGAAAFRADSLAPEAGETTLTLHGNVHGGQQPVSGATVKLVRIGTGEKASSTTYSPLATVTTGTDGSFSLTGKYTCGAATMVFLVATGGQPAPGVTNSNMAMMTALGSCSALTPSTFIQVNELTTVGAVAALAQYMGGPLLIGSSTGQGEVNNLVDQFTLAGQLVSTSRGTAPGDNVPSGWSSPATLINTLGNILAACVNSGGTADSANTSCSTLFNNAKASDGTVPTDTITALLNIVNHPTANTTTLFNMVTAQAPFAPTLSSAPSTFAVDLQPPAYTVTRTLLTLPDTTDTTTYGFQKIYDLINAASSTIDMTIYSLGDTTAINALVAACNRGVTVRVILDKLNTVNYSTNGSYNTLNATPNCSAVKSNPAFSYSHQKSIVFDNAKLALMTANMNPPYKGIRDFILLTDDPQDIAAVEDTFQQDFTYTSANQSSERYYSTKPGNDLIWAPTSAQPNMLAVINNATTSVTVENEELSASSIVNALAALPARGVACNVVMTYTPSSSASTLKTSLNTLVNAGCNVRNFPDQAAYIYIHAKVTLADYGTPAAVAYMGSINFTTTSMLNNRELGTILTDTNILSGLNTALSADFNSAFTYSYTP